MQNERSRSTEPLNEKSGPLKNHLPAAILLSSFLLGENKIFLHVMNDPMIALLLVAIC